ncbi:acyl carrier protein [Bremerella cremea]|uniref:Acyl carrier protein n=2 Tax=Bremerella cremea TaxID=1031537 RepID=A0A368KVF1_9BACT|nr:acyl carrier protein [Bremerella cremea]
MPKTSQRPFACRWQSAECKTGYLVCQRSGLVSGRNHVFRHSQKRNGGLMQDQEVFEWLKTNIVQTRQIRPEVVRMDSSLSEDLIPDSFEMIELVCQIEKQFGFRIDYDDFSDMQSVGDVVAFIQQNAEK